MSDDIEIQNSASKQVKALYNLLKVTEGSLQLDLLFSFPLPNDLVSKYDLMRQKSFKKADIQHKPSRIWQLQRDAHYNKKAHYVVKEVQTAGNSREDSQVEQLTSRLESCHQFLHNTALTLEKQLVNIDKMLGVESVHIFQNGKQSNYDSPLQYSELETGGNILRYRQMEQENQRTINWFLMQLEAKEELIKNKLVGLGDKAAKEVSKRKKLQYELTEMEAKLHYDLKEQQGRLSLLIEKYEMEKREAENTIKNLREEKLQSRHDILEDARKCQIEEYDRLKNERDSAIQQTEKLQDEVYRLKEKLKSQLGDIERRHETDLRNLQTRIEQDKQIEIDRCQDEITELRQKSIQMENELSLHINKLTNVDLAGYQQLKDEVKEYHLKEQIFKEILQVISEYIHPIFRANQSRLKDWDKYESKLKIKQMRPESLWAKYTEAIVECEFTTHLITKLNNDNKWLTDRVAQLESEKDEFQEKSLTPNKSQEMFRQVITDINSTHETLKDFENARDRLLAQITNNVPSDGQESSSTGFKYEEEQQMNPYSTLYKKYMLNRKAINNARQLQFFSYTAVLSQATVTKQNTLRLKSQNTAHTPSYNLRAIQLAATRRKLLLILVHQQIH